MGWLWGGFGSVGLWRVVVVCSVWLDMNVGGMDVVVWVVIVWGFVLGLGVGNYVVFLVFLGEEFLFCLGFFVF